MTRTLSQKALEKAAEVVCQEISDHMSDWFSRKVARLTITAYLDEVEREAPASDPAPAGWRLVPVEPDQMQIIKMRDAFKATRVSGVGGQTIEATFALDYAREIAAYRAALAAAPEPPVSDIRLFRTYAWSEAAAFLSGRIAQAEEDAETARSHKGKSRQDRETKRRPIGLESLNEILTEERGEDIAAEIIAEAIRANADRLRAEGEPK